MDKHIKHLAKLTIASKSIFKFYCLALFLCIKTVHADDTDFSLTIDKYYSPYMGANLMIAGLRGYQAIDDIVASGTVDNTSTCMTVIRGGKWLFEFTLSNFTMVLQHELFGHGARAREFNMNDIGYHINIFSGTTTYSQASFNALDNNQKAALSTGGVEATSLLAQQLEREWMFNDIVDNRAATMYLVNSLDEWVYAFGASGSAFHPDNDAIAYIDYVNAWYAKKTLTSSKLRLSMAWNWINPMLYISSYSLLKYIWQGHPSMQFSTLHIGNMRFMPTTHTLFAPWGPEYQLQTHLYTPEDKYIGLFLRYGKTGGKSSYGFDLITKPMAEYKCWHLVNKLSVWYQPHLLKNDIASTNTNKYGFGEFLSLYYKVTRNIYANGEIGYKVSGYMPGVQLARGVIWRVGFAFNI